MVKLLSDVKPDTAFPSVTSNSGDNLGLYI